MDPIYNSYYDTFLEGMFKRKFEFEQTLKGKIEKQMMQIAKKLGVKFDKNKDIEWAMADLAKDNVVSKISKWSRNQPSEDLKAFIIEDEKSDYVQVIISFGGNQKYNRQGRYMKVQDEEHVLDVFVKFSWDLQPIPSAADVNREMARFRNGRL